MSKAVGAVASIEGKMDRFRLPTTWGCLKFCLFCLSRAAGVFRIESGRLPFLSLFYRLVPALPISASRASRPALRTPASPPPLSVASAGK